MWVLGAAPSAHLFLGQHCDRHPTTQLIILWDIGWIPKDLTSDLVDLWVGCENVTGNRWFLSSNLWAFPISHNETLCELNCLTVGFLGSFCAIFARISFSDHLLFILLWKNQTGMGQAIPFAFWTPILKGRKRTTLAAVLCNSTVFLKVFHMNGSGYGYGLKFI